MASVYIESRQRKNGISYIVYFDHPYTRKTTYYKAFTKKREAQQAANDLRALIDTGKIPEKAHVRRINPLTFKEVAVNLAADWELRCQINSLSEITYNGYRLLVDKLVELWGDRLLCEIQSADVIDFRNNLAIKKTKVTSNRYLFVIKQIFKFGIKHNAIKSNPAESIPYLSEKEHERNRFLLPHEIDVLVTASKETRAMYYLPALIFLGVEHGTAKQEALDLKWTDINFSYDEGKGIIRFHRTKNKRERLQYIMPKTREALLEWKNHQDWMRHRHRIKPAQSDLVFSHLDGKPIRSFKRAWQQTCSIAGIEDFHYHDLRHTYCSNLTLSGAGLKTVSDMIGHSDLSMTNRYTHLTLDHYRYAQEQLADHYAKSK